MQIIREEWLDAHEASKHLGITYGALRNMIYRRELPFYKLGCRLRFKVVELDQILKESRQGFKEWSDANQGS
jgi:excisionase family DNA binding protein